MKTKTHYSFYVYHLYNNLKNPTTIFSNSKMRIKLTLNYIVKSIRSFICVMINVDNVVPEIQLSLGSSQEIHRKIKTKNKKYHQTLMSSNKSNY